MSPVPEPQVEPDDGVHVQVAPVSAPGTLSDTVAPIASDGPVFETVIVYVSAVPGTAEVFPSSLLIESSTCGVSVSSSVAELLPVFVSVVPAETDAEAVFNRCPRADGLICTVSV